MTDKNDKKGKISDYNKIPVKQREYYYDREETDKDIQKDFGDMLAGLKDMNKKFRKEAGKENITKLDINLGESMLKRNEKSNDVDVKFQVIVEMLKSILQEIQDLKDMNKNFKK